MAISVAIALDNGFSSRLLLSLLGRIDKLAEDSSPRTSGGLQCHRAITQSRKWSRCQITMISRSSLGIDSALLLATAAPRCLNVEPTKDSCQPDAMSGRSRSGGALSHSPNL